MKKINLGPITSLLKKKGKDISRADEAKVKVFIAKANECSAASIESTSQGKLNQADDFVKMANAFLDKAAKILDKY
jgi:hypothetical protein